MQKPQPAIEPHADADVGVMKQHDEQHRGLENRQLDQLNPGKKKQRHAEEGGHRDFADVEARGGGGVIFASA